MPTLVHNSGGELADRDLGLALGHQQLDLHAVRRPTSFRSWSDLAGLYSYLTMDSS